MPENSGCIEVLDAPLEQIGSNLGKVVLTLRRADARPLHAASLCLPETGVAVLKGWKLVLEGNRASLHRALRQVLWAELKQPESTGLPSP